MKRFSAVCAFLFVCQCSLLAWSYSASVNKALDGGDVGYLASLFNDNLQVQVLGNGGMMCQVQARQVLSDFFGNLPSHSFTNRSCRHEQDSETVQGLIKSSDGSSYSVFVRLRRCAGGAKICHVRIDNAQFDGSVK